MEKTEVNHAGSAFVSFLIVLFFSFSPTHGFAGAPPVNIIVTQVDGRAFYADYKNQKPKELTLQAKLTLDSYIILKPGSITLFNGNLVCHQDTRELNIRVGDLTFSEQPGILKNFFELLRRITGENHHRVKSAIDKGTGNLEKPMLLPAEGEILDKNAAVQFVWRGDNRQFYDFKITSAESYNSPAAVLRDSTADTTMVVSPEKLDRNQIWNSNSATRDYQWTILLVGGSANVYRNFSRADIPPDESIAEKFRAISGSKYISPEMAIVLKAIYYEQQKMYSTAFLTYQTGLKKYSTSAFIKMQLDDFCDRMDEINNRAKK